MMGKQLVLALLLFLTLVSCSASRLGDAYGNFTDAVSAPFNRYNYYSDIDTYRPESWRPVNNSRQRYGKAHNATPPKDNWKNYKVGGPYAIAGQWYYPKEDVNYKEVGIASWYGSDFHNKNTANGEIFDRHLLTAAHRTLPMPSMVRVTNLENGRSMLVRVNDRGPFAKDRIIDLSERAAHELGFREHGTAKVKVEFDKVATSKLFYDPWNANQVAEANRHRPTHATSPGKSTVEQRVSFYSERFVQAGAYTTWDNASSVAKGLKKIAPVHIKEGDYRGGIVYRVRLGPFDDEHKAGKVLDEVALMGFGDAVILGE